MLKRLTAISIISTTLVACGNAGSRSTTDPSAYGNIQGATVTYSGPFSSFYTPIALQGFLLTESAITQALGGYNSFGICNGIDVTESLGHTLCGFNKTAIDGNNQLFPMFHSGINVGNFVVAGASGLGITSVQPYRILYDTPGAPYQFSGGANAPQTVSAAILMPESAGGPLSADKIKGVLLYYHPTILSKGGVPSDFDGDLTPNNSEDAKTENAVTTLTEDAMLAAVYASQGYVVIAPDYVGQGANYQVQHPYVIFAETNAQSGLIALKAARKALKDLGADLPTPTKLYISSYSEGGPYALWASKLAQTTYANFLSDNGFTLRRAIGASGAYDLTGATLNYEFANASNSTESSENVWNVSPGLESGPFSAYIPDARAIAALNQAASKTSLAGYVLTALAYYNSSSASLEVLAPNYSQMKQCVDWVLTSGTGTYPTNGNITPVQAMVNCPLPFNVVSLFNTSGLTQSDVANQSFASALAASAGSAGFLTGGQTFDDLFVSLGGGYTNNSVGSFIEPGILTDPTIIPFIAQQNIQSWKTNSPLSILFLNYDSTVPNINGLEACGNIPNFPGYQPNYTNGVKDLSESGLVTCVNLPNNGQGIHPTFYTQSSGLPMIMDHGQAEAVLQVLALDQITQQP